MNFKKLLAAASMFAMGSTVFAQANSEYVEVTNFVSTKTRAEVQAELASARASGELARNAEYVEFAQPAAGLSRAEVRAELDRAYKDGQLSKNTEWIEQSNIASTRTRAEVREEALQAARQPRAGYGS